MFTRQMLSWYTLAISSVCSVCIVRHLSASGVLTSPGFFVPGGSLIARLPVLRHGHARGFLYAAIRR
jgi:hypothetical protein